MVIRKFRALGLAAGLVVTVAAQTVQPDTTLSADDQASRFLAQATFGPSPESIAEVRSLGYDYNAWLDREIAKPPTYAAPLAVAAKTAGQITSITNTYN